MLVYQRVYCKYIFVQGDSVFLEASNLINVYVSLGHVTALKDGFLVPRDVRDILNVQVKRFISPWALVCFSYWNGGDAKINTFQYGL